MGCCDNVKRRLNQTSSYCGWARCPPEPHKLRLPSSSLRIRNHTPKNNKRFLGEETGTQYLHLENLIRAGISLARLRDDPRKPREHCGNVSVHWNNGYTYTRRVGAHRGFIHHERLDRHQILVPIYKSGGIGKRAAIRTPLILH